MKFHKLCLLPIALSFLLIPSCNNNGKQYFKIMSFNIEHGSNYPGDKKVDLDGIVDIVKKYNPDVLNINEIYYECTKFSEPHQVKYIGDKLGYYHYFVHGDTISYMNNGDYGGALFSKYPINDPYTYAIPNPASAQNLEKRAIGKVAVKLPNGHTLNVVQSHFGGISEGPGADKLNDEERQNALNVLTPLVKDKENTVFTGDLNLVAKRSPDTNYIDKIKDMMDETIDENLPTFDSLNPNIHIDYMFCSHGMKFRNGQVLPDVHSDHLPIMCEIEV